jgi:hypothetical protein
LQLVAERSALCDIFVMKGGWQRRRYGWQHAIEASWETVLSLAGRP